LLSFQGVKGHHHFNGSVNCCIVLITSRINKQKTVQTYTLVTNPTRLYTKQQQTLRIPLYPSYGTNDHGKKI
jgi:hypothetical protein